MSRVSQVVKRIGETIINKDILEVACGCADFSLEASKIAKHVSCIDLDDFRLNPQIKECDNVAFFRMDATKLQFVDKSFDTIVIYNAVCHIKEIIPLVLSECMRVLRTQGQTYIISSFASDKVVIREELLPYLSSSGINISIDEDKYFIYLRISPTSV